MISYKAQKSCETLEKYLKPIENHKKQAQREQIIQLLRKKSCSCSDFMRLGIAQYNARILELRKAGYSIVYIPTERLFKLE